MSDTAMHSKELRNLSISCYWQNYEFAFLGVRSQA